MIGAFMFYAIVNIFIWIALMITSMDAWNSYGFKYAFVYPWIWETLDDHDINILGKLIVCVLFSIIALPAYILSLITLGLTYLAFGIVKLFCLIFKKRKH